jgi:hypothetical protein
MLNDRRYHVSRNVTFKTDEDIQMLDNLVIIQPFITQW